MAAVIGNRNISLGVLGGTLITAACYGGGNVFGCSPYDAATTRYLKATYGAYWQAIRDYGLANPQLVPFVNSDPQRWGAGIASGRRVSLSSTVWQVSEDKTNPDAAHYWGLYESARRKTPNIFDIVTIKVSGKAGQFKILIDSYAESNYDYALASELDAATFDVNHFKEQTKGWQRPPTLIENFKEVVYDIPDDGEHTIQVAYRTDGSTFTADDRAYLLIPAEYGVVDNVQLINSTIPPLTDTPT